MRGVRCQNSGVTARSSKTRFPLLIHFLRDHSTLRRLLLSSPCILNENYPAGIPMRRSVLFYSSAAFLTRSNFMTRSPPVGMFCCVWLAHVCAATLSELQSGAHPLSTANFHPPAWRRSAQPANSHLALKPTCSNPLSLWLPPRW
jgi:hypothetical protein